nr:enolase [Tanacetum cinerariifolium]
MGKGVLKAVANINGPIRDLLLGKDPVDQKALDHAMIKLDGTENKASLVANAGYKLGTDVTLALDCAASEFYKNGKYTLSEEGEYDSAGFADYLADLVSKHPIISIEDGLDESDWDGWKVLTDKI